MRFSFFDELNICTISVPFLLGNRASRVIHTADPTMMSKPSKNWVLSSFPLHPKSTPAFSTVWFSPWRIQVASHCSRGSEVPMASQCSWGSGIQMASHCSRGSTGQVASDCSRRFGCQMASHSSRGSGGQVASDCSRRFGGQMASHSSRGSGGQVACDCSSHPQKVPLYRSQSKPLCTMLYAPLYTHPFHTSCQCCIHSTHSIAHLSWVKK